MNDSHSTISSHRFSEDTSQGRILVVEDNPKNRKLVRSLLEIHHFTVLEAGDAETGIQIARQTPPDLILMDIQLPGMDGLQATRIIKSIDSLQHIKVVALTSYAMEGDAGKAKAAGCDGYITKPINTRQFIDDIRPCLPEKRPITAVPAADQSRTDITLLIVDDDPMNLKLLHGKLCRQYPNIIKAVDGYEALAKAKDVLPDLILLDIMMPGLNGFEVTRQLKANAKTRQIPIILITALDGHDYKVMGSEAGADDFLNKPVNTHELHTRVKSLLNMKVCQDRLLETDSRAHDTELALPSGEALVDRNFRVQILVNSAEQCNKISMYLFGQGYDIHINEDLERSAERIRQEPPDILIMENQSWPAAWIELCANLKNGGGNRPNCQVLFILSETNLESNFSDFEDYIDDFLTQPINIYELRARIKVLLKKKALLEYLSKGKKPTLRQWITDPATGLYNFEYCIHVLKHELQRFSRETSHVAIVMMAFNMNASPARKMPQNEFDAFVIKLGALIKKNIRKLDVASRRSDQTFFFVLPETDEEKTFRFIHRLKKLIDRQLKEIQLMRCRASDLFVFGYAVCPNDSIELEALLQTAENRLKKTAPQQPVNADGRIRATTLNQR
ncbi:Two component system response regulator, modulated diguanylate cyclase (modular protein) [Desulfosarcina cetonica]|uniref:response regulator n=1 Tax=Desulfosarcina cetonica TaxID=90730 RepID=UPI0006D21A81|nr:response regulator [Desulfosarcina cetonica]VTR65559.1 Two component system response regulator, modulated diguanylate cyclase (modular protein) [Desulfosarcina cetonica]